MQAFGLYVVVIGLIFVGIIALPEIVKMAGAFADLADAINAR